MVKTAEALLENSGIQSSNLDNSQINNLLNVANSETCPEVIINYIRYQTGRHFDKKWGHNNFAINLIEQINDLKSVSQSIDPQADEETVYEIWIHITRLMLGYLKRHFYYLKEVESQSKKTNIHQGRHRS